MYALTNPGDGGNFYPRPPRGGRRVRVAGEFPRQEFLSTPSARRATASGKPLPDAQQDFYPRPPRGGRPLSAVAPLADAAQFLSTPSARRATVRLMKCPKCGAISIHALREEGDSPWLQRQTRFRGFLSTPSARRATKLDRLKDNLDKISIHALREEGDRRHRAFSQGQLISIHALREEGDRRQPPRQSPVTHFYPRPPRGGRPLRGGAEAGR